jgi:hypothetical protein
MQDLNSISSTTKTKQNKKPNQNNMNKTPNKDYAKYL